MVIAERAEGDHGHILRDGQHAPTPVLNERVDAAVPRPSAAAARLKWSNAMGTPTGRLVQLPPILEYARSLQPQAAMMTGALTP